MGRNYPAFLQFHHLNNCFGYVKNEILFDSTVKINYNPASLGDLLGTFIVRSCSDPHVTLVVQLYGRQPFSHLFLNAVLATNAGFQETQEVIVEVVEPTNCQGVEIVPMSAQDYEIMDKSSSAVESLFLDQLTVVKKDMVFPLWLSPSMHVLFKIVNIVPPTDSPVYLVPSSELYVLPYLTPAKGLPYSQSSLSQVDTVFHGVTTDFSETRFHSSEYINNLIIRCLPRLLFEKCKIFNQSSHPSLIYTLNKDEQYSSFNIVSTYRNDEPNAAPVYAVLIQVPINNVSNDDMHKAVISLLKHRPNHFISTNPLYSCYTQILCQSVNPKNIWNLKRCQVSIMKKESEDSPSLDNKKLIERSLQSLSAFYPIIMGCDGIKFILPNLDQEIKVFLEPSVTDISSGDLNKRFVCYAARNNTIFVFDEDENQADSDIIETPLPNHGLAKLPPILNLDCQSPIVHEIMNFVNFFSSLSTKKHVGHILLLGKEGCGKTYIVSRVARKLAKSSQCVFSHYIDCCAWKGKQSDTIEKSLISEMKRLEKMQPALLVLDNLDFFQVTGEDEHRQLAVERLFNMLHRVLLESTIPVLTTARKLSSLHKSLSNQGSKRAFANVIEIPTLNQVS
ncbi:unnamed protein product [Auanema sp. JU1783]|nr:unnamed protein product [Auanema sp. JU1783]